MSELIDVDVLGRTILRDLMLKWGCGPGEVLTEYVGADVDDGPGEVAVGRMCRSNAHNHAYWGIHCGFAGDAASSALVVVQNALYAATRPTSSPDDLPCVAGEGGGA